MSGTAAMNDLMRVENVKVHFPIRRGFLKREVGSVRAVDGITLDIRRGETLSIVGESGCGKTTFGQALVRVLEPTDGRILYREDDGREDDITHLGETELRPYRAQIRMMLWTLDDLVRNLMDHYQMADIETRRLVPLKWAYWPA